MRYGWRKDAAPGTQIANHDDGKTCGECPGPWGIEDLSARRGISSVTYTKMHSKFRFLSSTHIATHQGPPLFLPQVL
jgi:hypothetical protein